MSARDGFPDVFSAREIALAAGVDPEEVSHLVTCGIITTVDGQYVSFAEAIRVVRCLRQSRDGLRRVPAGTHQLFALPPKPRHRKGVPLAAAGTVHLALAGLILAVASLGLTGSPALTRTVLQDAMAARVVFLNTPGPGGGGGGGGKREPDPPPKAERKGTSHLSSPLPRREPPPVVVPVSKPVEPPPVLPAEKLPPITAPIVAAPADAHDKVGVLTESTATEPRHGPGTGGGAGTGDGTGLGWGDGNGVGPGSGGGFGGGPYRPGAGIEAPRLLREVKPDYTDDARRRGITGDVVLEIVVRRDGGVGDVRVLQSLGSGLDQRAIDAVRQWRFDPARRLGTPVDVIVEVAVEFKLR